MGIVHWSTWTSRPPRMDGTIVEEEWRAAEADAVPLPGNPGGTLLIQNDSQFLYLAIDLPEDTEAGLDTGDYFWFSVDVDQDYQMTPNVDLNYAQAAGEPDHLVRQLYLAPDGWTGPLPDASDSICARGFGPTSLAPHPHTTWTARIELGELQAAAGGVIFFGLRVASANPAFAYDVPQGFFHDFSSLVKLHLAERPTIPMDVAGDVLAGVGLIPATKIQNGYATTDPGYRLEVTDSAFGGLLDLVGNGDTLARLWAAGARRYRILHQYAGTGFAPIDQTWMNYQLVGRRYEPRPFGPDAAHTYPLTDPQEDYSIEDLLLQWNSATFPAGLHDFRAEFYAADGSAVGTGSGQTLTLMVDNGRPVVRLDEIRRADGSAVRACDFVSLRTDDERISLIVTATDARGHLRSWTVTAEYGETQGAPFRGQTYPPSPLPPDRRWYGVTREVVRYQPPVTCAYLFRVAADLRVTNGYSASISSDRAFKTLTLVHP